MAKKTKFDRWAHWIATKPLWFLFYYYRQSVECKYSFSMVVSCVWVVSGSVSSPGLLVCCFIEGKDSHSSEEKLGRVV
jgi:hypothetical protein